MQNRLYLLNVVGKGLSSLMEDLEKLNENVFNEYSEDFVQYGNSIYFVSNSDTESVAQYINKQMGEDFGYIILDITDSLNVFDFRGNLTDEHLQSEKFINIISRFSSEEIEKTDEEMLAEAIDAEDYDLCCKLRDKINSSK
jgi:hypothetical protein